MKRFINLICVLRKYKFYIIFYQVHSEILQISKILFHLNF